MRMHKDGKTAVAVTGVLAIAASVITVMTGGAVLLDWVDGRIAVFGALVIALLGVVMTLWRRTGHEDQHEFQLFMCDAAGFPRTDVAIEGPSGTRYPDAHGIITVNSAWHGQEITIHDVRTWRLLQTEVIDNTQNKRIARIVLKDEDAKEK